MRTPILFLGFNRPKTTQKVFEAIREAKPAKLYIALDGPRSGVSEDITNVSQVKDICLGASWGCQVRTLFRKENLGCRDAVSKGIDWFFENEEEGIILEDDCVPNQDFFRFCQQLLERYRDEPSIYAITGNNFQRGQVRGEAFYYYSLYSHVWGWATWRQRWKQYDVAMKFWPRWRNGDEFASLFKCAVERDHWKSMFDRVYRGEVDTWDFQWLATIWRARGLTVTPQVNLVTNIGFGSEATHTKRDVSNLSIPSMALKPTGKHPSVIKADHAADEYVFDTIFFRGHGRLHQKKRLLLEFLSYASRLVARLFNSTLQKLKFANGSRF